MENDEFLRQMTIFSQDCVRKGFYDNNVIREMFQMKLLADNLENINKTLTDIDTRLFNMELQNGK